MVLTVGAGFPKMDPVTAGVPDEDEVGKRLAGGPEDDWLFENANRFEAVALGFDWDELDPNMLVVVPGWLNLKNDPLGAGAEMLAVDEKMVGAVDVVDPIDPNNGVFAVCSVCVLTSAEGFWIPDELAAKLNIGTA